MKTLYVLFLTLTGFSVFGQTNVNFYRIEKEGDKLLASGRFDDAILAYSKYKIIANGIPVPEIDKKIANAKAFLPIYNEADRLFRAERFMQAIKAFQEYRKLFPGISIHSIDSKIENGLVQIERKGNDDALATKDKVILGFETNYLAEQALEEGDFKKAMDLYKSALSKVKDLREGRTVANQANERIGQILKCLNIQKELESIRDPAKQIELLESYKAQGGIVVKPFESKLAVMRLSSDGLISPSGRITDIVAELNRIAGKCDINGLVSFLGSSDPKLYTTIPKDSVYKQLNEVSTELSEVRSISLNGDNDHRNRFVFGGYESLILQSAKIPVIGDNLSRCIKKEYFSYLFRTSQNIYDREMNLMVAREIAINAKEFAVTSEEETAIVDLISKINSRIGCDAVIRNTSVSLGVIESNLAGCRLGLAKSNFGKMMKAAFGCKSPALETRIAAARQQIASLETKLNREQTLRNAINNKLNTGECSGVEGWISELEQLDICNAVEILAFVGQKRQEVRECARRRVFNDHIGKANQYLNRINISSGDFTAIESQLKEIEDVAREAEQIAVQGERGEIDSIGDRIRKIRSQVKSAEERQRKAARRTYNRIIKPEVYVSSMLLVPKIWSGSSKVKTANTMSGNYEAGINVRFLKREALVGSVIGLHYTVNDFQIFADNGLLSERLRAEFLTGEYKITSGFKRNNHPYLGIGFGVSQPIKVKYNDLILGTTSESAYFGGNKYVNTLLFSSAFIGYEAHRRNLGFSIEAFIRFSGVLEDERTKETLFPTLKYENFRFGANAAEPYNSSVLSYGLAVTFHLW